MILYRQKHFFDISSLNPMYAGGDAVFGKENNPMRINKAMQYQDIKNGNYLKALKKGFYVSKEDRDAWKNGTYEGQNQNGNQEK